MPELKWPVTECESCDYNLREATPKASEKSNVEGRPNWTDFCPRCGHGYIVADRVLPAPTVEVLAEREAQAILKVKTEEVDVKVDPEHQVSQGEPFASEASGVPPDQRGSQLAEETDPEGLLNKETTSPSEGGVKPEPGAVRPPGEGEYFCTKCASVHRLTSKVGKRHIANRE